MSAQPVARVGDVGVSTSPCTLHSPSPLNFTFTWTTSNSLVFIGPLASGISCIRTGDIGSTSCGHHVVADSGSTNVKDSGLSVHRAGDTCHIQEGGGGIGVTTTGSSVVDST